MKHILKKRKRAEPAASSDTAGGCEAQSAEVTLEAQQAHNSSKHSRDEQSTLTAKLARKLTAPNMTEKNAGSVEAGASLFEVAALVISEALAPSPSNSVSEPPSALLLQLPLHPTLPSPTLPEEDKDEYQVVLDDNSRHRRLGHIHACRHGDDDSDCDAIAKHSLSGEKEEVEGEEEEEAYADSGEDWQHEQDDEEEVVVDWNAQDDIDDEKGDGMLACSMCKQRLPFDDFPAPQQMDLPPAPAWVRVAEVCEYRFCFRHDTEDQKKWTQQINDDVGEYGFKFAEM